MGPPGRERGREGKREGGYLKYVCGCQNIPFGEPLVSVQFTVPVLRAGPSSVSQEHVVYANPAYWVPLVRGPRGGLEDLFSKGKKLFLPSSMQVAVR